MIWRGTGLVFRWVVSVSSFINTVFVFYQEVEDEPLQCLMKKVRFFISIGHLTRLSTPLFTQ